MEKAHIIAEIRRTAAANSGKALGRGRFEKETGIRVQDWFGKYWARWGDAVKEAGYLPNALQDAYEQDWLIERLVEFIREIGRFPTNGELRLRARNNKSFPSHTVFRDRLGRKADLVAKINDYCSKHEGYEDILELCRSIPCAMDTEITDDAADPAFGYVYMLKSGRHYKVGHSNSAGRREYELAIQLPEQATTVHAIATDDPLGIEAYWHKRFDSKRLNGEWFKLNAADIRAFKRRKFM